MQIKKAIIIAIDGHSSCGKSTFAKLIAKNLGYKYIDTGAMYRAATLFALQSNFFSAGNLNTEFLVNSLSKINIDFQQNPDTKTNDLILNGKNVEEQIRSLEVSNYVSEVSAIKEVREKMVALQQDMGQKKGIVMDGRDIGTVVFPDAELKIFLTASPEIRAERRYQELIKKGDNVSYKDVLENVMKRDEIDSTRKESPLKQASGALLLDNSNLSMEEEWIWVQNELKKLDVL